MLIIRAKIRAAQEQQKKSLRVFRCPVYQYPGLPFRASVLIFEFVAEKTGLFGRENLFFGLHRFWRYTRESINCPRVPMNRKVGKPWFSMFVEAKNMLLVFELNKTELYFLINNIKLENTCCG